MSIANDDDPITGDVPITDGGFINEPLRSIKVTGADDGEDGLDLGNRRTTVFLRNEQQVVVRGNLNYDGNEPHLYFSKSLRHPF